MEDGKTKYCVFVLRRGSSCTDNLREASKGVVKRAREVREAYIEVGWAFTGASSMEQCKREGFSEVLGTCTRKGASSKGSWT